VALNESKEEILFGEAKWTNQKAGESLLNRLEDKAEKVRWENKNTRENNYVLFSKNGFTTGLIEAAEKREDLKLYSLEKVSKMLEQ